MVRSWEDIEENRARLPRPPLAVVVPVNGARARTASRLGNLRRRFPGTPILVAGGKAGSRPRGSDGRLELPLRVVDVEEAVRLHRQQAALSREQSRLRGRERRLKVQLKVLGDIARKAHASLEPRRVTELIASCVRDLVGARRAVVYLLQQDRHTLVPSPVFGCSSSRECDFTLRVGEGVVGRVVQRRRAQRCAGAALARVRGEVFDVSLGGRTRSVLGVPLISRARIIGALELRDRRDRRPFTDADQQLAMGVAEAAAIALDNAILFKRCQELSVSDDLTHLYNARYLKETLMRELKRARRYGSKVSLIFADLDGFKSVNDHHGHLTGSRTLMEVAQVLHGAVREIDIVSRYGGDEFTVVLPHTDCQGARIIAERVRVAIEGRVFMQGEGLSVRLTASLGVSCFPEPCRSAEELLRSADAAMYKAKARKGNGVWVVS